VRLRSAGRGIGTGAFGVYSSGNVGSWYGVGALRSAPACKITKLA